jgi:hypothetical protein
VIMRMITITVYLDTSLRGKTALTSRDHKTN